MWLPFVMLTTKSWQQSYRVVTVNMLNRWGCQMSEKTVKETPEKMEGYEKDPLGMGGYPIDSMLIRYEPRTIHEVCVTDYNS